jgi:hypothetical protein
VTDDAAQIPEYAIPMSGEQEIGVCHAVNRFSLCVGASPPAPASPRSSLGPLFRSNVPLI